MTDRPKSTPMEGTAERPSRPPCPLRPPVLPVQFAFRETYLWRFYRPEVIDAFRLVGDALFDLLNEAGAWGPRNRYPATYGELRAACSDLDHLAGYLDEVASERYASELDSVAAELAEEATGWSERLSQLVVDMRQALNEAAAAFDADSETERDLPAGN